MANVIGKLNREFSVKDLSSKSKATYEKYYQYSRNVKSDYRWLLMFIVARFPFGRALGAFFSRNRHEDKSTIFSAKQYLKSDLTTSSIDINQVKIFATPRVMSMFKNLDSNLAVESIKSNGYYQGLKLPDRILQEILEYASVADISIDGDSRFKFKFADRNRAAWKYNREILIGNYLAVNSECSAMQTIVNDPKIKEIATKYLGKKPVLVRSQMGWTFVGTNQAYSHKGEIGSPTVLYHYDLDDYLALKFFFYLTDVDSLSGSHRCVAGSHRKRKLTHYVLRGQTDQEIADYYGAENMIDICGQAGFGFAEDPFCFHRGSPPVTSPRLMIQLEFALNDYGMWEL